MNMRKESAMNFETNLRRIRVTHCNDEGGTTFLNTSLVIGVAQTTDSQPGAQFGETAIGYH